MRGVRNLALAVLVGAASLGSAGAAALVSASPGGALPSCTDSWQGPSTGTTDWNTSAANWSSGFPTGSSVVCITEPGTYTVSLAGSTSVNTLGIGRRHRVGPDPAGRRLVG